MIKLFCAAAILYAVYKLIMLLITLALIFGTHHEPDTDDLD